jgi:hypothetical protein
VIETADDLVRARQAHEAHDWSTAAARFDAVGAERLTADDLTAYADALWWLGRVEDNLRVEAAAHERPAGRLPDGRLRQFFSAVADLVTGHVADSQVWRLPGAGHFAPVLEPESVSDELITFFESARQPEADRALSPPPAGSPASPR